MTPTEDDEIPRLQTRPSSNVRPLAFFAIVLTGALLRIPPLFHDFWLDEAFSYLLVQDRVDSPFDILTRLRVDNNHPLNSLFLFLAQGSRSWFMFRLPAWMAGVGSIALAGIVMRRFGRIHALCSMLLVACSYPLIVYSTEARGYGLMLFFALLSIESAARWTHSQSGIACSVFWAALVFGFLSHLTFIHCYGAVGIFTVAELIRTVPSHSERLQKLLVLHGPPFVFLCGYYWVFVRHLTVAGAEPTMLVDTLLQTMTMTAGAPDSGPVAMLAAMGVVVVLAIGLHRMRVASLSWFLLFLVGIVVLPLALTILRIATNREPTPVFPRYFLTSIMLFVLLAGFVVGEAWQGSLRQRLECGVMLALVLIGNAYRTSRFAVEGRGQYLAAVRYLAQQSEGAPLRVASNSDFRTSVLLSFYRRYLPSGQEVSYLPHGGTSERVPPDWWILELLTPHQRAPGEIVVRNDRFVLRRQFGFYGPSGCSWAIYQRNKRVSTKDGQ